MAVSLERLLERQAGVVTLAQAVAEGTSADTVRRRARDGRWTRLHPSVYLVGGHRLTGEARTWAAWLWAGQRSTASGPAAAFRHGMLTRAPDLVDVTVPAALHRRPAPGVRWHRHDLLPVDRVFLGGLGVTAPALTAVETALALPDGSTFLDRALQRHVRFPTLYRTYCRHLGRPGWARARDLICASTDRADSAAERLLVRILRDGGVTGWVLGHPFGPWRIDLAQLVATLERDELIRREPDEANRRILRATLTDRGRERLAACHQAVDELERRMLADFTPEQEREFRDALARSLRGLAEST